jgi:Spy/CpxP family protein refolding chaperone
MAPVWDLEWAEWVVAWAAGSKDTVMGVIDSVTPITGKVYMKTTNLEIKEEPATILCRILGMSVKKGFFVVAIVLFFMALCVVVFAGEPGQQSGNCDLQSGSDPILNLSKTQCENIQQLTDRFRNDTATTRGKIIEKRIELRRLSEDLKTDPYVVNKVRGELNALEQTFSRRAYRTEADQRKLLTPEQINKIKDKPYGYGLRRYGGRGYERQ